MVESSLGNNPTHTNKSQSKIEELLNITWLELLNRRRPSTQLKASWATAPPSTPPSCETILKSFSKAPSKARTFWMSGLCDIRAWTILMASILEKYYEHLNSSKHSKKRGAAKLFNRFALRVGNLEASGDLPFRMISLLSSSAMIALLGPAGAVKK